MANIVSSNVKEYKLTGPEAKTLRTRNDWSLQYLANLSGINKAYLSEFENGLRTLPADRLAELTRLLTEGPAGTASPEFVFDKGYRQLRFVDAEGKEVLRPQRAFLTWTESDGTTYRMFIGER